MQVAAAGVQFAREMVVSYFQLLIKTTTFLTHSRACKREARKAVDWIEDHLKQGFEVTAIVTANDSSTCGVTNTKELSRRHLDIKMTGWNQWDNSEAEAARIGRLLDLKV